MEIVAQIVGGLLLLALGGEGVVRGAVGVARRLGLSELLIGLTLVGFGTSAPELLTSVNAALSGSPGIAVGNVVGSNICNILLIFALVTLIRPVALRPAAINRDGLIMVAASVLIAGLALAFGELSRPTGVILLAMLAVYILIVWWMERRSAAGVVGEDGTRESKPNALWVSLMFALGGLALLIFGADLLVHGAVSFARIAGMSETVIGLTIVAVGTSLPELVATLAAALKGKGDVAFGNILGSNIYNIFGILGVTSVVHPIAIPADVTVVDWGAVIGSAVLLVMYARTGGRVSRLEGLSLIAMYGLYVWYLLAR